MPAGTGTGTGTGASPGTVRGGCFAGPSSSNGDAPGSGFSGSALMRRAYDDGTPNPADVRWHPTHGSFRERVVLGLLMIFGVLTLVGGGDRKGLVPHVNDRVERALRESDVAVAMLQME